MYLKFGNTPLHDAARNESPAIVAALLKDGANTEAVDTVRILEGDGVLRLAPVRAWVLALESAWVDEA